MLRPFVLEWDSCILSNERSSLFGLTGNMDYVVVEGIAAHYIYGEKQGLMAFWSGSEQEDDFLGRWYHNVLKWDGHALTFEAFREGFLMSLTYTS